MSEDVERIWAEATRRYPDPHPNASGLNSPRRIAFKVGAKWAIDAMTTPQVVEDFRAIIREFTEYAKPTIGSCVQQDGRDPRWRALIVHQRRG